MTREIDHVLLTRFNLPSIGTESIIRAKDGWLRQRVELFERYCLRSVRAQINKNFEWIIYFDPESPDWLRDRIDSHTASGTYTPVFRATVSPTELIEDLRRVIGPHRDTLITTNLDNDDGLATDFTDRLQRISSPHDRAAVYLTKGLIKSQTGLYLRTDRHNAFCSVVESWDQPKTCWSDWHNLLSQSMPTIEVDGPPAWLQVIHGANVSNRTRGKLVSPSPYTEKYPGLLDDLGEPTPSDLSRDLLVDRPKRFVRESGRAAAKGVAMRVLGKDGLDRAKNYLAHRSWTSVQRTESATRG